jgi:UDP-glucose 6-dehydrogenase
MIAEEERKAGDSVKELCEGISAPLVRVDTSAAEMIKFASSAFLATKIFSLRES